MNTNSNILITGAAGFIASCMASFLNKNGFTNLFLVDDFSIDEKRRNHEHLICIEKIDRNRIEDFFQKKIDIDFVIHFGARTDTTEMDYSIHEKLNLNYSKLIWNYCTAHQVPLIYASSAATYGDGAFGYEDNHDVIYKLEPLNPYGVSKNEFDKWALQQSTTPPHWYGLKFFNVYGPNEYHKRRMASVIFHAFNQIKHTGNMKLFRSHNPNYSDGGQLRDFIYVKDLIEVTFWLMINFPKNGLYNLGTGKAATFNQLAEAVFNALNLPIQIEYIDTPIDIRDKYQYFTEANMDKLKKAGYSNLFKSIDEGTEDYIKSYLNSESNY